MVHFSNGLDYNFLLSINIHYFYNGSCPNYDLFQKLDAMLLGRNTETRKAWERNKWKGKVGIGSPPFLLWLFHESPNFITWNKWRKFQLLNQDNTYSSYLLKATESQTQEAVGGCYKSYLKVKKVRQKSATHHNLQSWRTQIFTLGRSYSKR